MCIHLMNIKRKKLNKNIFQLNEKRTSEKPEMLKEHNTERELAAESKKKEIELWY